MYVQYGCGFSAPAEWVNFDASMTLRWERMPIAGRMFTKNSARFPSNVRCGDIVKGLPISDGSCRGVYASHVLEHLAQEDFHKALENTKRILTGGGLFRLVVPDLEFSAIVRSAIEMGHSLGLKVVAEGIETEAAGVRLRDFGCDIGQGYLYAKPMPCADFETWLDGKVRVPVIAVPVNFGVDAVADTTTFSTY